MLRCLFLLAPMLSCGNGRTLWSVVANLACAAEGLWRYKKSEEMGLWNTGRCSLIKILYCSAWSTRSWAKGSVQWKLGQALWSRRNEMLLWGSISLPQYHKTARRTILHNIAKPDCVLPKTIPWPSFFTGAYVRDLPPPHSPDFVSYTLPSVCPAFSLSAFLEYFSPAPALGPLLWLFLLPRMFFPDHTV